HYCGKKCVGCLFDYETPVMLVISSKRVGAVFRLIQMLIIAYVIVYECWIQQNYQETDSVVSSVSTKVKGTAVTNTSVLGVHVWDVAEYIIPPQGENSFFVLTNMIVTPAQMQSRCPEVPGPTTVCLSDSDCRSGYSNVRGSGVQTGLCVNYSASVKTCEVLSWCPLENDTEIPEPALLEAAEDFTVLIKNSIHYPKFKFRKQNILPHINSTYLKNCTFNRKTDPECPIFRMGDMLEEAGEDFRNMAVKGGAMGILLDWTCDLDMKEQLCVPKYTFSRLDNKNSESDAAHGYNFRYAKYFKNSENTETRTLVKAYGIRFDVIVFGKAGKFSTVQAIIHIGATLSFLSLVNAVCDWFVLNFMEKKNYYKKHKFIHLDKMEDTDALVTMIFLKQAFRLHNIICSFTANFAEVLMLMLLLRCF
uniref:P2X purinoceptor n=1 Tax=Pygocentrus nattereri TaxID=42514 RepID=A0AAR2LJP8_PYGNA